MRLIRTMSGFMALISMGAGLLSSGCGGGGVGGGMPAAATPATALRTLQTGDTWNYDVSGQQAGGASRVVGSSKIQVVSTLFRGVPVQAFSTTTNISGAASSVSFLYFHQDPISHSINDLGDDGGPGGAVRTVTSESGIDLPGIWSAAVNQTDVVSYDTGQRETTSFRVIGSEEVQTPAGTFKTWKAAVSRSLSS